MKYIFQWIMAILLVVAIGVSCSDNNSSSDPVNPGQIQSIRTEPSISNEFRAAKEENVVQINIPQQGDYRLVYTTTPGTFELLFRLNGACSGDC